MSKIKSLTTGIIVDAEGIEHYKIVVTWSSTIILTLMIIMIFVSTILLILGFINNQRITELENKVPEMEKEIKKNE